MTPLCVHLIDGTYELFRQFYGRRRFEKERTAPFGAVAGVLHSILEMIEKRATSCCNRSVPGCALVVI